VLAALYRDAARQLGPLVYTPGQVRAWASFADDSATFGPYILDADTWVAERVEDGLVLGFCGVAPAGPLRELHSLYVKPSQGRQGLGSEMLRRTLARAESAGAERFSAWVTPLSRPLFLAAGFAWTRTVVEPFAGTLFERYRLERS
jgi:N-acetylglutamate synthase-like GNAT family acetyltransferase